MNPVLFSQVVTPLVGQCSLSVSVGQTEVELHFISFYDSWIGLGRYLTWVSYQRNLHAYISHKLRMQFLYRLKRTVDVQNDYEKTVYNCMNCCYCIGRFC